MVYKKIDSVYHRNFPSVSVLVHNLLALMLLRINSVYDLNIRLQIYD